jgi:predicted amidohydrolase
MKIALLQLDIIWEAKDINIEKAELYIKKASDNCCDVAVLPEMFNTGFSMNISKIAEDEEGTTHKRLSELAKKYHINIIAGYSIKKEHEDKGRNIAAFYNRKGIKIAEYSKIHPFSYADEDKKYNSGKNPILFEIEGIPASVFICYDLRFPEIFRTVSDKVYLIFVIANWPASRIQHWDILLKARAIENQCFIIGVNRIGFDGNRIYYNGHSQIISPWGDAIVMADETAEYIDSEIDIDLVKEIREKYPFLKDKKSSNFTVSAVY